MGNMRSTGVCRRGDDGGSLHILQNDDESGGSAIRRYRDSHAQTIRRISPETAAICTVSRDADGSGENLFTGLKGASRPAAVEAGLPFLGGLIPTRAPSLCAIVSPTANRYKRLLGRTGLYGSIRVSRGRRHSSAGATTTGPRCSGRPTRGASSAESSPAPSIRTWGWRPSSRPAWTASRAAWRLGSHFSGTCTTFRSVRSKRASSNSCLKASRKRSPPSRRMPWFKSALGPELAEEFLKVKRMEWVRHHNTISPWEIETYLTLF